MSMSNEIIFRIKKKIISFKSSFIYQTFPTFERAIFVIGFKIGYYSILLNKFIKLQKNI